eukprot:SAG31_NODE_37804_length_301_cov_1.009901_1_plen_86_part_10
MALPIEDLMALPLEGRVSSIGPKFAKGDNVMAKLTGENPRTVHATVLKIGTHVDFFNDGRIYVEYADKKRGSANVTEKKRLWVSLG